MQEKDTFLSKTARALALIQDIGTSIAELEKRLAALKTELDGVAAKPALPEAFVDRQFLVGYPSAQRNSNLVELYFGTITDKGDAHRLGVKIPLATDRFAGVITADFYSQALVAFEKLSNLGEAFEKLPNVPALLAELGVHAGTPTVIKHAGDLNLMIPKVSEEGTVTERVVLPAATADKAGVMSAALYMQLEDAVKRLEAHEKYIDILRQEEVVCRCTPADGRVVVFKAEGLVLKDKTSDDFVVVEATDGVIKRKEIPQGYNAVSPYDCEEINYFDLRGFNYFGRPTIINGTLPQKRYSLKLIEGLTNMEDITTMYQIDGWGVDFPDLERVRGEWNTINCKSFCQTFCHYWPDQYTPNFVELPSKIETGNAVDLEHLYHGLTNIRQFPDIDARSATTYMWMCDEDTRGADDVRARFLNIGTQPVIAHNAIYLRIRDWNVDDMRDTLLNYSFDRAAAGYNRVIIYTSQNTINKLTTEELAAITAKGYTVTVYK